MGISNFEGSQFMFADILGSEIEMHPFFEKGRYELQSQQR
jgi:hypothetical protein